MFRKLARKNSFLYLIYSIPKLLKGYYPILLDYPFEPVPRYGYSQPPHGQLYNLFAKDKARYQELLKEFLYYEPYLTRISLWEQKESTNASWMNKWLSGLDTLALYCLVAKRAPKLHIEIGSGYSTKVTRRAISDFNLSTQLVSIDPHPRAEIDSICNTVIRKPLQQVDTTLFRKLSKGDVLFMDGSHRCFMNSDVTVFFLEILPMLPAGVLVHLHDIELPYDYMPERAHWFYSEQYLLAVALLGGHANFKVVLPAAYVSKEPDCMAVLQPLFQQPELLCVPQPGVSFWLETL